ncbi:MAG TPA: hypothetical protein VLH15_07920 [Dehalococcoidales bacterium]|nr:hypothetical protein [Dehalococcoidales bacterium]
MSKEKPNKKKQSGNHGQAGSQDVGARPAKRYLTDEEKAWIIKERLARRPVIIWRYRNGKWNRRLIFMLALMAVALVAAFYFLSQI